MGAKRILCYSPYTRGMWAIHGLWEMTILHAAVLRGAEVQRVMCDALFSDCDVFWGSQEPRFPMSCVSCQADVTRLAANMGMEYRWLGRYLTQAEEQEARRWADALAPTELATASYGDFPVADWVRSSVRTHLRDSAPDATDPEVQRALRSYAYSGLIACFALTRLLDESRPDAMLQFNGRMSSTRVAFELARRRGIHVITHERGWRNETLTFFKDVNCLSLQPFHRYWEEWGEVPLDYDELEAIRTAMAEREHGRNLAWHAFTNAPTATEPTRLALGLSAEKPLWVLFTSSDDEVAGNPDHSSPFRSQLDWVKATIEHARRHPQIELVIRVHPNTGSKRSYGRNKRQLEEMEGLRPTLPVNVRMVAPDDEVSSYSLMNLCAVGLVWASTAGLELACKGKNVVVAAGNPLAGKPFALTVEDPDSYGALLDPLLDLAPGVAFAEIARQALRFAHGLFIRTRIPFPLVKMPGPNEGRLAYDSLQALQPGSDAGLDRAVRILLDDEPPCLPPTAEQRARSTAAEDLFLESEYRYDTEVVAFADELLDDSTLLAAWDHAFGGHDAMTLLIQTREEETPALVELVNRLGLGSDDGPRLVAESYGSPRLATAAAVYTQRPAPEGGLDLLRVDLLSLADFATSVKHASTHRP